MSGIVILAVVIAVITGLVTLVWWKVGDQWASDEYKKFGRGGGNAKGPPPTVISDFNPISGTQRSDPEKDLGGPVDPDAEAARQPPKKDR